mgnify:CR=1 FL=1
MLFFWLPFVFYPFLCKISLSTSSMGIILKLPHLHMSRKWKQHTNSDKILPSTNNMHHLNKYFLIPWLILLYQMNLILVIWLHYYFILPILSHKNWLWVKDLHICNQIFILTSLTQMRSSLKRHESYFNWTETVYGSLSGTSCVFAFLLPTFQKGSEKMVKGTLQI